MTRSIFNMIGCILIATVALQGQVLKSHLLGGHWSFVGVGVQYDPSKWWHEDVEWNAHMMRFSADKVSISNGNNVWPSDIVTYYGSYYMAADTIFLTFHYTGTLPGSLGVAPQIAPVEQYENISPQSVRLRIINLSKDQMTVEIFDHLPYALKKLQSKRNSNHEWVPITEADNPKIIDYHHKHY